MSTKKGLFSKVGKTRIVPIGLKILLIFITIILLSNFATNFLSLQLSKKEIITLNNTIMVEQLKELYTNATNQYQIYNYSDDKEGSIREYYDLTNEFATLLYGLKWVQQDINQLCLENIINQSEKLWRKFLAFGINNIGGCEE